MWTLVLGFIMKNRYTRGLGVAVTGVAAVLAVGIAFWLWLAVHDASVADAARRDYVKKVEFEALEARLKETERQKLAAMEALGDHRLRTAEAVRAKEQANVRLKKAIAADRGTGCTWTDDDIKWLRRN